MLDNQAEPIYTFFCRTKTLFFSLQLYNLDHHNVIRPSWSRYRTEIDFVFNTWTHVMTRCPTSNSKQTILKKCLCTWWVQADIADTDDPLHLILRDLRGNSFQCDCENKWLMTWLKNTNATVSDVFCEGPSDMKGKRLNDLPIPPGGCISTGEIRSMLFKINYHESQAERRRKKKRGKEERKKSVKLLNNSTRHKRVLLCTQKQTLHVYLWRRPCIIKLHTTTHKQQNWETMRVHSSTPAPLWDTAGLWAKR